jgi:asparagine synthetase B (glutamine-hydrolysing)
MTDFLNCLREEPGLVTAFSGGADSALLAAVAHMELGSAALAVPELAQWPRAGIFVQGTDGHHFGHREVGTFRGPRSSA